jgi:ribosomal protein L11 methyltransferase
MTTVEQYSSLTIDLPSAYVGWISARLSELGFLAFEEQACPAGARIIVYHQSEARLELVRHRLEAQASGMAPSLALKLELGRPASSWALAWTEHLQPVKLTERITLFPHAPTRTPLAGELYLKPAFAFGFGEHPSTRLSARWLEGACRAHAGCSVLDVGCGTGVLALVAHLSGASRVLGLDVSGAAVEAARANAELNRATGVVFRSTAIGDLDEQFDRVVANIEASVLFDSSDDIARSVAVGGELALSGFIVEQCEPLLRRYREVRVKLELREEEGDWCLLVGQRLP